MFYAWAQEQERGGISGHRFATQDVFVPFHDENMKRYERYCHVYHKQEIMHLFELETIIDVCEIKEISYDCGNWRIWVRAKNAEVCTQDGVEGGGRRCCG